MAGNSGFIVEIQYQICFKIMKGGVKMYLKIVLAGVSLLMTTSVAFAQNSGKQVKQGNKSYSEGNYSDAEIFYRRALETDNKFEKQAMFNLGNVLYKQERYDEAMELYNNLAANESLTDKEKAQLYHNLGNAHLMQQQYQQSIDAYKQALRINPNDEDTRYNLSYAMKMLKQQQNQDQEDNQQQNQDKNENEDEDDKENENNQNQNEDKDDDQNEDNQDKNQNGDENEEKDQQQQPQMSKQEMERMLNALSNKDKQTLDELREEELKKSGYQPEKDW